MKFTNYWNSLDKSEKEALANALDTSPAYLYQIASGRRNAGAKIIMGIESATKGKITPTDIRTQAA